jgi:hypothetical protein
VWAADGETTSRALSALTQQPTPSSTLAASITANIMISTPPTIDKLRRAFEYVQCRHYDNHVRDLEWEHPAPFPTWGRPSL